MKWFLPARLWLYHAMGRRKSPLSAAKRRFPGARFLILCRYHFECGRILSALKGRFGKKSAALYANPFPQELPCFTIMHIFADEQPAIPWRLR